jgi:hypothetical protein
MWLAVASRRAIVSELPDWVVAYNRIVKSVVYVCPGTYKDWVYCCKDAGWSTAVDAVEVPAWTRVAPS